MPLIGRVAWLWSEELPNVQLALCFSAFKRLRAEKKQQRNALKDELHLTAGEPLTIRQGSFVRRGTEALVYLALKWNRPDLAANVIGGEAHASEEVLAYLEWLEELYRIFLHGLAFPQLLPPAGVDEIDVCMEVQKARCEAERMLLQLENDLATKSNKRLCAGRLTIADLFAIAVLKVADLIGQEWFKYPSISQYVDSLDLLPGCTETFQKLKNAIDEARHKMRESNTGMITV